MLNRVSLLVLLIRVSLLVLISGLDGGTVQDREEQPSILQMILTSTLKT